MIKRGFCPLRLENRILGPASTARHKMEYNSILCSLSISLGCGERMNARLDLTQKLLDALTRSDESVLRAVLTESPAFMALNVNLAGIDSVLDRIAGQPSREMYRQVVWSAPELTANGTRAAGHMPKDAPRAGCVLTFAFEGDRIGTVQHQNLPPRPAPANALRLTPILKQLVDNALASRHPMLVAYTDENGQPVLSFRGSVQALGDDQLALWVRNANGGMLRSLQKNPKVAL